MHKFKSLIMAMPEKEQAFTSKKDTWKKYLNDESRTSIILKSLFREDNEVVITRGDLFDLSKQKDLSKFIVATLLWGYPAGMRGNHFLNITNEMNELIRTLNEAKKGVSDWSQHYEKVKSIKGLGLSTYTKFLYFLSVSINDCPALILDDRIIKTMNKQLFSELDSLKSINSYNAVKQYPNYLKIMNTVSTKLEVENGKLEMFLFEFGLNLKLKNS